MTDSDSAEPTSEPRAFVFAEEFGMLCIIPADLYVDAANDADALYRVCEQDEVSLGAIDDLVGEDEHLRSGIEAYVRELVQAQFGDWRADDGWDHGAVASHLVDYELITEAEAEKADWRATPAQIASLVAHVGDSFGESSGLRAERWAEYLPDEVVTSFESGGGGMFGDYFGFDWDDESEIRELLERLGHSVVDAPPRGQ